MIVQTVQVAAQEAHNHVGQALLGTTGGAFVFGLTIGQINEYLQAAAFLVTMLTGAAAFLYYRAKTREINDSRKTKKETQE